MSLGVRHSAGEAEAPVRRGRVRRFSLGHLAVAVGAVLALVANLAFMQSIDDSVDVVVAARPVAAGEVITAGDLTTVRMRTEAHVLAGLVTSTEGLDGRIARRDLADGELIGQADLLGTAAPGGLSSMAIPIDPAHAAGGIIRVGDRVDVVDVNRDGVAAYVVRDAPVIGISAESGGALAVSGRDHLVLGLDSDQVLAVAAAIADGEVDIVVTTGSGSG